MCQDIDCICSQFADVSYIFYQKKVQNDASVSIFSGHGPMQLISLSTTEENLRGLSFFKCRSDQMWIFGRAEAYLQQKTSQIKDKIKNLYMFKR